MPFPPDEPPCNVLGGWLLVSQWKAVESIDHYGFCSISCLHKWTDTQVPRIPDVFLKSLDDENEQS